ncbi:MAG: CheR family methyltransferase [Tatlockia sp.]|jgi:chemotaxis protein methyltransferase CheR
MSKLKDWAKKTYGLVISNHLNERMENGIKNLLLAHNLTENRFVQALLDEQEEIINETLEVLTIQESYFFRDTVFFAYLKNRFFSQLIEKKRQEGVKEITIWSAGCAQGEEIYSIAIFLFECLPDRMQWKINLLGTDISALALSNAQQGIFTQASLRSVSDAMKTRYFIQQNNRFILRSDIREMVTFSSFNLARPSQIEYPTFDLILCRNVVIYLSNEAISTALHFFYEKLDAKGALFLGAADNIHGAQHQFTPYYVDEVYFFKKEAPVKLPSLIPQVEKKPMPDACESKLILIRHHLDKKNHQKALLTIDAHFSLYNRSSVIYRYKAEALIGLNQMEKALHFLQKAIELDSLEPINYFLKGLIEIDLKYMQEAIISLQKALYLNNHFSEAAYYLGLIYLQKSKPTQGLKLLKQALNSVITSKGKILYFKNKKSEFINALKRSIAYHEGQKND